MGDWPTISDQSATLTLDNGQRLFVTSTRDLRDTWLKMIDQPIKRSESTVCRAFACHSPKNTGKMENLLRHIGGSFSTFRASGRDMAAQVNGYVRSGKLLVLPLPAATPMGLTTQMIIHQQMAMGRALGVTLQNLPDPASIDLNSPDVLSMSEAHRMMWITMRCGEMLQTSGKADIIEAFKQLLEPKVLLTVVAGLIVWAASHAVGIGFLIDIAMVVVIGVAVLKAFEVMWDIHKIISGASNKADLDRAAKMLAGVIISLGIGTFLAIVTRGAAKSRFRPPPDKSSGSAKHEVEFVPTRKRGGGETEPKKEKKVAKSKVDQELDSMYKDAPAAKKEIDTMADELAEQYGGSVAKAPLKGRERAKQKIENDYQGDASKLKDVARNTIIVPKDQIQNVKKELGNKGADVWEFTPDNNALGYSGINTTIKTKNGLHGEVQVNSPEMIYAKEPENIARTLIGDDAYNKIAKDTGIEGGLGHKYYEDWRVIKDKESAAAKKIAEKSKKYYKLFGG